MKSYHSTPIKAFKPELLPIGETFGFVVFFNKVEEQKRGIESAIIKEKIQFPVYTEIEYKMALSNYRKVDISGQDGKRKIINTFINAIYVFDDHLKIIYNGKNKEETVSLEALEGSNLDLFGFFIFARPFFSLWLLI